MDEEIADEDKIDFIDEAYASDLKHNRQQRRNNGILEEDIIVNADM